MKKSILVITNLYPNIIDKNFGIYNKQQLYQLKKKYYKIFVIAPIPWIEYFRKKYFLQNFKKHEEDNNIEIYHPIYYFTPRILRFLYGLFFFLSIFNLSKRIIKQNQVKLIYGTWLYPDGFSAYLLSRIYKLPVVLKAHGSDVNYLGKIKSIRFWLKRYLKKTNKIVTVSNDLKNKIINIIKRSDHIVTIYNGIDIKKFKIMDKVTSRRILKINEQEKLLLYIGNIRESKGVFEILDFYKKYELDKMGLKVYFLGDGEDKFLLQNRIKYLNYQDKIFLLGRQKHSLIPVWLNAADFLILLSKNEGVPNVVLESMACGVPVLTRNVGGIKEVFDGKKCGIWYESINRKNIQELFFIKKYDRQLIRNSIKHFSWAKNGQTIFEIFENVYSQPNYNRFAINTIFKNNKN